MFRTTAWIHRLEKATLLGMLQQLAVPGVTEATTVEELRTIARGLTRDSEAGVPEVDARLGCLMVVAKSSASCTNIMHRLENIEYASYLNLPSYGSTIALRVMQNKELSAQWKQDVMKMASRVKRVRKELRQCLEEMGTPGTWKHITEQSGMFSYIGMSPEAARHMVKDYHVYMLESGRINMCGITRQNMQYVARAIYNSILHSSSSGSAHVDKLTNGSAHVEKLTNGTAHTNNKLANGSAHVDKLTNSTAHTDNKLTNSSVHVDKLANSSAHLN